MNHWFILSYVNKMKCYNSSSKTIFLGKLVVCYGEQKLTRKSVGPVVTANVAVSSNTPENKKMDVGVQTIISSAKQYRK